MRVHLIDEGSGVPTLLLHGNPDSAGMWRPVIERIGHRLMGPGQKQMVLCLYRAADPAEGAGG